MVKTFLFGAVAFAICLLSYHVMWLWHDFGQGDRWTHFEDTLVFANALVYFNSLVNPFIFGGTVAFKVTRPSFFEGVPSYFEALWYSHLYFYRKSNT